MKNFYRLLGVIAVLGLITLAGLQASRGEPARAQLPGTVAGFQVRVAGAGLSSLRPATGEGVVLVVSRACPHCHTLLEAWARERQLAKLDLFVLEGAEAGRALVDSIGFVPGRVVGPVGDAETAAASLGIRGTPTLLQLRGDSIISRMVGVPDSAEARRWLDLAR